MSRAPTKLPVDVLRKKEEEFLRGGRTRLDHQDDLPQEHEAPDRTGSVAPVEEGRGGGLGLPEERPGDEEARRRPAPVARGRKKPYPWEGKRGTVLLNRTYRLPERLLAQMEFAARRRGVTMTALIQEAVEEKVIEVFEEEGLPYD